MRAIQFTPIVLMLAWTASAQDVLKPKQDPKTDPKAPSTHPALVKDHHFLHKTGDVIGKNIRDAASREEVGEVKDLVINRDGWVDYAVVKFDKGLKTGDKLFIVPWQVVTHAAGDRPDDCMLVVNVDKERLRTAPSFDDDKWPDLALGDWSRTYDEFYRDEIRIREASTGETIGEMDIVAVRPAGMKTSPAFRASKIKGCKVTTTSGEKAGEIDDMGLDDQNGRVALLVLSTGGFLGLGEDHYALPWQAFSFSAKPDDKNGDLECRLTLPESKLENAPKFDRSDWKRVSDPAYVEKVYTHFGYPTYWKRDVQKTTDDSERPDKPKDDKEDKDD